MAELDKKRVFMLAGHAQCGKTSLAEAILYQSGATTRWGKVDEGNTVSDYEKDEIERKSSINASFLNCKYKNYSLQFIDTPGYLDFVGEIIAAARGSDFAVIVVDAASGVEVGTEKAWEIIEKENLPCLFFINKLDKEEADFSQCLKDIKNNLTKKAASLALPLGKGTAFKDVVSIIDSSKRDSLGAEEKKGFEEFYSQIVDIVAESDDALLEKYLDKGSLEPKEVLSALNKAVRQRQLFPVLAGNALSGVGIELLLQVLTEVMPAVSDRLPLKVKDSEGKEILVESKADGPFAAQVIKSIFDPYVGQLSIFRVFSGKISSNGTFYNQSQKTKERFSQIFVLQGKEQQAREVVSCGDIAAVAKLKNAVTSDTLAEESFKVLFERLIFPVPTYSASIKPKTRQDEDKISQALTKLTLEDPTLRVSRDTQTKELIISGTGELHINIIMGRLKERFSAEVTLGRPKVPYKETITKAAKVQGKYKKQTGGHGQYGDVWIEVEPLERGKDFEFVDKIVGGRIPRNFIPSVEKGIRKAMEEGFLAGYPLVDIKVTLFDGSYHPVDSSDMAFQIAGSMAFKKAMEQAGVVMLEPIMNVEITVPEEFMGQITGDINSRRGRVLGMEAKGTKQVVKAQVPLSEMFSYASDLRSVTGGRGSYLMSFSHYEIVPQRITQSIVEAAKKKEA